MPRIRLSNWTLTVLVIVPVIWTFDVLSGDGPPPGASPSDVQTYWGIFGVRILIAIAAAVTLLRRKREEAEGTLPTTGLGTAPAGAVGFAAGVASAPQAYVPGGAAHPGYGHAPQAFASAPQPQAHPAMGYVPQGLPPQQFAGAHAAQHAYGAQQHVAQQPAQPYAPQAPAQPYAPQAPAQPYAPPASAAHPQPQPYAAQPHPAHPYPPQPSAYGQMQSQPMPAPVSSHHPERPVG